MAEHDSTCARAIGMTAARALVLTHGDPYSPHSFSGSNLGLLTSLGKLDAVCRAADVEVYGLKRKLAILCSMTYGMERWRHRVRISQMLFEMRSAIARRAAESCSGACNCILQMGAMFSPDLHASMGMPIFSYHDNTVELSRKSKTMSWHHTVGPDLYRKAYDREKSIYDMDSRIFTFSDHVKKSLVRDFGIPEEKVSTVYCGANFDVAAVPAVDKAKAHEGKTVLFVGTDFVRKGGETLLQAFKTVRREVRGARLVIVGSEPKVDMEGVVVRGFINKNSAAGLAELLTLYAEASVFTMPSLFEPFGIPYVEAMFCRTACVGTNIAAIPEMITDGDNGFLVEPGDHAALAERLICLLKDRRLQAAMGERGFARARQCFTWDVVAEKMVKDVQRCL